jgi:hypothetical protein
MPKALGQEIAAVARIPLALFLAPLLLLVVGAGSAVAGDGGFVLLSQRGLGSPRQAALLHAVRTQFEELASHQTTPRGATTTGRAQRSVHVVAFGPPPRHRELMEVARRHTEARKAQLGLYWVEDDGELLLGFALPRGGGDCFQRRISSRGKSDELLAQKVALVVARAVGLLREGHPVRRAQPSGRRAATARS